jgi:hypothetical protein
LAGGFVAQRNEINRLAPGGRLFGATGGHHLTDDRRQYGRRVLPTDQIEAPQEGSHIDWWQMGRERFRRVARS